MIRLAILLLAVAGISLAVAQTVPQGMNVQGIFSGINARNAAWAGKADLNPAAVTCAAGTVSLTTLHVVNGTVVHC